MFKFLLFLTISSLVTIHGYSIQPRILNGVISNPQNYPFFVQLRRYIFDDGHLTQMCRCGSSLLTDSWILTAAHCVEEKDELYAFFGINQDGKFLKRFPIQPENVHLFPDYIDNDGTGHDIALIKLTRPIVLSEKIQPVQLPSKCGESISRYVQATMIGTQVSVIKNVVSAATDVHSANYAIHDMLFKAAFRYSYTKTIALLVLVGTGSISLNNTDGILRETELTTIPSKTCPKSSSADLRSIICTKTPLSLSTPFLGDSGGPLLRASDNTQIGVMSQMHSDKDGIMIVRWQTFTNVHFYFDWISKMTGLILPKCDHLHT